MQQGQAARPETFDAIVRNRLYNVPYLEGRG